jgi:sugar phosphate isomerase/epimerase
MGNIILSAFADEYSKDIDAQIKLLSSRGIGYIEPRFIGDKNVSELTASEARELSNKLSSAGIGVSAIGSPIGKINLADDFDRHLDLARNVFEVASILGAKNIRMFSFYLREGQSRKDARGEVIEKLGKLLALADTYSLKLCHENEAKIYGESVEACLDILKAFDGKLRAVFDMGNFVLDGEEPYPYGYHALRDYIEYFHIKDSLSRGAIVPAGKGEAHIADILREHKEYSGRDFFISLEPHLETFQGLNKLVGKAFENPYKFESGEAAFIAGLDALEEILASIG